MTYGEWLTRLTIWVALATYAIGAGIMLVARGRAAQAIRARWAWTIGCAFFLAHVVCAFTYYHHWSHAAAYRETALQTREMTGYHWGGGLFLNYLVAVGWLAEVLWWWVAPDHFARRSRCLVSAWHSFLFFMVFNGTVVFGSGPVRWVGLLICTGLAGLWWRGRKTGIDGARR